MSDVKTRPRRTRFIWADKTALAVAFGFFLLLALLWVLALIATGPAGATHVLDGIGVWGVELDLLIAGSLWAVLRAVDFVLRGPTYRLFTKRPERQQALQPAFVSEDKPIIAALAPAEGADFISPAAPLGTA